jgi:serine protease Do
VNQQRGEIMSSSTNKLIAKPKRLIIPAAVLASVLAGSGFIVEHSYVHAAVSPAAAPIDESSISSLTALDQAVESVAGRVTPAVVNVAVTARTSEQPAVDSDQMRQFFKFFGEGPQMAKPTPQIEHGIGSGAIISPDGYIVTNAHVVQGATEIRVTLNDRRVLPAKLIGTDKLTDLAVIKVNATNLPSIPWGDSTKLKPGQTVLAFGSPFGYFQFSVTRGIVSALDRPNPFSEDARKPGGFIQTDAAINRGNSGGPLVNAHGEVVGINTFLISDTGSFAGAGFAIPTRIVRPTVQALIKDGVVHHGYLGIGINPVTPENAKFFDLKNSEGALVSQVTPDSPAGRAGLKQGDVVTQIDGQQINSPNDLQMIVSGHAPGTEMTIHIIRDGKPQSMQVKLGEFHSNQELASASDSEQEKGARLGVQVSNLTPEIKQELDIPTNVHGVVVQDVNGASPADDAGLSRGDVIQEVNRQAVQSAADFSKQVHSLPKDKDLLLLIWSSGGSSYRVIHPATTDSGM